MATHDERLEYYMMLTRLVAEAESQLQYDAADPAAAPYMADLTVLREAIAEAREAGARIVLQLVERSTREGKDADEPDQPAPRH